MKKKAQLEIMGLAVVVILISLIVLFVVKFVVLREPKEIRKEYTEFDVSYSFINTLVNTNSPDCSGLTFTELFKDCASPLTVNCGSFYADSCEYIEAKVTDMLSEALGKRQMSYSFMAYKNNDESVRVIDPITAGGGCPLYRKSAPQPLPAGGGGIINLRLDVC